MRSPPIRAAFSPLRQIDTASVKGLEVDWFIDLPDKGGLVSTPLLANGVFYFIGSLNVVRAVDATSGRLIKGMPAYRNLTDERLLVLRHFIRQQAEAALAVPSR